MKVSKRYYEKQELNSRKEKDKRVRNKICSLEYAVLCLVSLKQADLVQSCFHV